MTSRSRSKCLLVAGAIMAYVDNTFAQTPTPAPTAGCVTDYDESAGVDYFPDKAEIKYAQTFSVEYSLSYKVLNTTYSGTTTTYVLYQCGTPQPDMDGMEVQEYISVPVSRVATGTPDHIPRIQLLGEFDTLKAYTGNTEYVVSACLHAGVANGTIAEAYATHAECYSTVNNTLLMELGVEATFGDYIDIYAYCENYTEPLYKGVGVYSYGEVGAYAGLAEGEAVKLFSLFYNAEAKGNEVFNEIEDLWMCTTNNAEGCSLELSDVPEVAWFPLVPTYIFSDNYASGWGAPSEDVYYQTAVENAGGSMILCPGFSGNATLMNDEEMLACFQNASICVFASNYTEVETVMNLSALNQLDCVQNGRVYDFILSGTNAWFEAKSVEPHVLLEDLVVVLHGDDYNYGLGDYERLLIRNTVTEEGGSGSYYTGEVCVDPLEARDVKGECEYIIDFDSCNAAAITRVIPTLSGALWAVAMMAVITAAAGVA